MEGREMEGREMEGKEMEIKGINTFFSDRFQAF